MKSSNEKVNEFLHDLKTTGSEKWATVEEIRNTFLGENSMLEEEIKYGGIIYSLSGDLIGGVFLYKGHISIEFSNGANFKDDDGFLEGKGKKRRHLKILDKNDIKNKKIHYYIGQALNP